MLKNLSIPMKSEAQLVGFSVINGANKTFNYFAAVNTQEEIEQHRELLASKYAKTGHKKIQFVIRKKHDVELNS